MDDYISRKTVMDEFAEYVRRSNNSDFAHTPTWNNAVETVENLPSADVVNKTALLGWLLAYHTKSFELKGRYLPHEVIGWLVSDLSKNLLEEGEQDEKS